MNIITPKTIKCENFINKWINNQNEDNLLKIIKVSTFEDYLWIITVFTIIFSYCFCLWSSAITSYPQMKKNKYIYNL